MENYYVIIFSQGEAWEAGKPFTEQAYYHEHYDYIVKLLHDQKLYKAGAFSNQPNDMTGMAIVNPMEEPLAYRLIINDPAVQHGTLKGMLLTWHL